MRLFGIRMPLAFVIAINLTPTLGAQCVEVVPDDEVHCPYRPISRGHDLVFLDLDTGSVRSARLSRPDDPDSAVVLDPFFELGWTPGPASVAPDGERILVRRSKPSCPGWTGAVGPGLECSYGRPTLWLAQHWSGNPDDPDDDLWVHINLTRRLLGRNSEIHGWSTWLHRDLALFNAMVFPDDGGWYCGPSAGCVQEANAAQIYAVRFAGDEVVIEPFAPAALWRDRCLTGRVTAQPSPFTNRCFDGQRVSIVRRCYDEPDLEHGWAWFNTANADGTGPVCRADGPVMQVPVLRVFLVDLDESCDPMRSFEDLVPVRQPPDERVHRQMGMTPEWGDMLAEISPDGAWVAVATNMGDPDGDLDDNCAGFRLNLLDPTDQLSGNSLRWTHVCRLGDDLQCDGEAVPVGVERTPPEATALPGFVTGVGLSDPSLVYSREWGVFGGQSGRDIVRLDLGLSPEAIVPLAFGRNATAAAPIRWQPRRIRRGGRAGSVEGVAGYRHLIRRDSRAESRSASATPLAGARSSWLTRIDRILFDVDVCRPLQPSWTASEDDGSGDG